MAKQPEPSWHSVLMGSLHCTHPSVQRLHACVLREEADAGWAEQLEELVQRARMKKKPCPAGQVRLAALVLLDWLWIGTPAGAIPRNGGGSLDRSLSPASHESSLALPARPAINLHWYRHPHACNPATTACWVSLKRQLPFH